ncbi:hypothetical protein Hanom_Chr05g00470321 [Helianthus anomalus]
MPSRTHKWTNRIHDSINGLALCPKSSIEFVCTTTLENDQSEQPSHTKLHPIELQHYNHHKNLIAGSWPSFEFLINSETQTAAIRHCQIHISLITSTKNDVKHKGASILLIFNRAHSNKSHNICLLHG